MTTSNKLALCRGQTKPRLPRLARAPPNQAPGEAGESSAGLSARAGGGGERDDRSEVHPQRRGSVGASPPALNTLN